MRSLKSNGGLILGTDLKKKSERNIACVLLCPFVQLLTLPDPCISESCIENRIKLNIYFHTSLWCLKRFYEGLYKPIEAPQRSGKIKI